MSAKITKLNQPNEYDPLDPPSLVSAWTGLSESTLARYRMRGGGPAFIKLTNNRQGVVRYRRSDVEAWIASRVRRSTSESGLDAGLAE